MTDDLEQQLLKWIKQFHRREPSYIPHAEAFKRWPHTKNVCERITRLNPNGLEEGTQPRGFHAKFNARNWCLINDCVPLQKYIEKHGRPPGRVIKHGRHKFVSRIDYLDGT